MGFYFDGTTEVSFDKTQNAANERHTFIVKHNTVLLPEGPDMNLPLTLPCGVSPPSRSSLSSLLEAALVRHVLSNFGPVCCSPPGPLEQCAAEWD